MVTMLLVVAAGVLAFVAVGATAVLLNGDDVKSHVWTTSLCLLVASSVGNAGVVLASVVLNGGLVLAGE